MSARATADPVGSDQIGHPPSLGPAIVGLVLCVPLGLLAVALVVISRRRWRSGDHAGAMSAASAARLAVIAAIAIGLLFGAIVTAAALGVVAVGR